jgi:hypothetical protein
MSELVAFIKRVWHCSTLFFPHCFIGSLAQDLYKALLEQRRQLELDPDWLSKKPGEIVHYLWQAADREFRHVIPHQELLMGDLTGAYQHPPTAHIVAQCLSPSLTIAQGFLPTALRQRAIPPQVPQHTPNLHQPETNAPTGITDNEGYGSDNIDGQGNSDIDDTNCHPPGPFVNP